jgi:hypothetical protein
MADSKIVSFNVAIAKAVNHLFEDYADQLKRDVIEPKVNHNVYARMIAKKYNRDYNVVCGILTRALDKRFVDAVLGYTKE